MFITYDIENGQAFGPFDSRDAAYRFFTETTEGAELLGMEEDERKAGWAKPGQPIDDSDRQDFCEAFGLVITEVQFVGADEAGAIARVNEALTVSYANDFDPEGALNDARARLSRLLDGIPVESMQDMYGEELTDVLVDLMTTGEDA